MMPRRVLLLTTLVVIAAMLGGCGTIASTMSSMREMSQLQTKLNDAGFEHVTISQGVQMTNGVTKHGITLHVDRPPDPPFDQKLATQIVEIAITGSPRVQDLDFVTVNLQGSGDPMSMDLPPSVWMELMRDFTEPAGVKGAVLAKSVREDDIRGYEPVDPTTDFPTDQATYYAIFAVKNLPPETPVMTIWTAVDTHGAAPPNQKIGESTVKWSGSGRIVSSRKATPQGGGKLPKGSYRVDVIWDNTVQATLPFTVAGG